MIPLPNFMCSQKKTKQLVFGFNDYVMSISFSDCSTNLETIVILNAYIYIYVYILPLFESIPRT